VAELVQIQPSPPLYLIRGFRMKENQLSLDGLLFKVIDEDVISSREGGSLVVEKDNIKTTFSYYVSSHLSYKLFHLYLNKGLFLIAELKDYYIHPIEIKFYKHNDKVQLIDKTKGNGFIVLKYSIEGVFDFSITYDERTNIIDEITIENIKGC